MKYVNFNTPLCIMVAVFFTQATFGAVISVPNDYPTIQMAINAAIDGDEVIVSPGTWTNTPPIGISKNITLRSIDPTNQAVVASTILTSDINTGSGIMFSGPVNSTPRDVCPADPLPRSLGRLKLLSFLPLSGFR